MALLASLLLNPITSNSILSILYSYKSLYPPQSPNSSSQSTKECKNSIKIKSQPKPISSIPTVLMSCLSEDVNSTFISPTLIKTEKYSSLWSLTKKMPIKSMNLVALILILQSSSINSKQTPKTDFNKKFKYQSNMLFNMKFILKSQDSLYKKLLKVIKEKEPWNHLSEKENLHSFKEILSFKKKNLQLKTDNQ